MRAGVAADDAFLAALTALARFLWEVGGSPLAGHLIGDAGAEALARVLPLSGLKTIALEGAACTLADRLREQAKRRLLAACRQPNRSSGCEGAGARTAAESDDALSREYVAAWGSLVWLSVGACAAVRGHMRCVVLRSDFVLWIALGGRPVRAW